MKGIVLDVGCGPKPYQKYISCDRYVGIDESRDLNPDFSVNATAIPFEENYFDSVLCTEVLEHISEPEKSIIEIKRVIKNGGYLYMTVPQEWCLHYEPEDFWRFTKYGIKHILEKSGFDVIAVDRIGGLFSLIGQRLVDVLWHVLSGFFGVFCGLRVAERIASILIMPISLLFYLAGKIGDKIDKRDALGWAVLARKG